MKLAKGLGTYEFIKQPNHVETVVAKVDVDGEEHLVKFSRYHDNQQFWTIPGEIDKRLQKRKKFVTITEPAPDEFELYDLTVDPFEQNNLAHPSHASDKSKAAGNHAWNLIEQLAAKRLSPVKATCLAPAAHGQVKKCIDRTQAWRALDRSGLSTMTWNELIVLKCLSQDQP
jgi:hypothetical protein